MTPLFDIRLFYLIGILHQLHEATTAIFPANQILLIPCLSVVELLLDTVWVKILYTGPIPICTGYTVPYCLGICTV